MNQSRQKIRIADLGRIVTGKTPPTKQPDLYGTSYPFITPTDIGKDSRNIEPARFISEQGRKKHFSGILPPNAICFTCIASIGKICMTSQLSLTNQQINSIIVDQARNDPLYVFYLLRTEAERIKSIASGVATPIINKTAFSEIKIEVHPLPTQQKIASILSAYDDLIENNLRRIKILEEMAQNLYREWFVKLRFPGHQHSRFTDSPLGRIPEGWEVKALGKLADQIRDGVNPDSVDPGTPYFGLEHLPRKSITLADWGFAGEVHSTKLLFKKGDILFGKIRPYFHKVGVAPLSGVCSSDTIVIRPISTDLFGLILGCTSSAEFVEHATATSQGTKMPRANWDVLVKYQVPMPRQPIFGQFNEFMNDIVNQLHNFVFRNQSLRRTRDLLLPRLISGEVDVSELEIILPEEAAV